MNQERNFGIQSFDNWAFEYHPDLLFEDEEFSYLDEKEKEEEE